MRVFVSYPSQNLALATSFAAMCREYGHEPFIAPEAKDELIVPGGFLAGLCAEIERCDLFVLCVTKHSLTSRYQKLEWSQAVNSGKETPMIVHLGSLSKLSKEYFNAFSFSQNSQWCQFDSPSGKEQIRSFLSKKPPDEQRFQLMQRVVIEAGMRLIARSGRRFLSRRPGDGKNFETDIDVELEEEIRGAIRKDFPHDPILGEEQVDEPQLLNATQGCAKLIWTIDSIDGTLNYVSGDDRFCCAVGLMRDGFPYLGAVFVPAQMLLYAGGVERPATVRNLRDGTLQTLKTDDDISRLDDCWALTHINSEPARIERCFQNDLPRRLHDNVRRVWMWGCGLVALTALARGTHHLFVQRVIYPWDVVPGLAILHAAGGVSTSFSCAEPWRFTGKVQSDVLAACNGPILTAAMSRLGKPKKKRLKQ